MTLNLENDFRLFDGVEVVHIIQAGSGKRQVINNALQFGITNRDAIGSDGTYQQGDVKFNLAVTECVVFAPQAGDLLTQADQTLWSIGIVEFLTLKTRHQVWCKKVSLRPETAQTLKLYKAKMVKDATGAAEPRFRLMKEVSGHVNELASEVEVTEARRRMKITHQIFITAPCNVHGGMKVVDEAGNSWLIHRVTNKSTLGMATTLDVEKTRTPLID